MSTVAVHLGQVYPSGAPRPQNSTCVCGVWVLGEDSPSIRRWLWGPLTRRGRAGELMKEGGCPQGTVEEGEGGYGGGQRLGKVLESVSQCRKGRGWAGAEGCRWLPGVTLGPVTSPPGTLVSSSET